jgi:hydroxymethylpyrimidine pyrophosphatase-like HAD family hydrolase
MLPKIIFHDADGCLNDPSGDEFTTGDLGTLTPAQQVWLAKVGASIDNLDITLVLNTGRNFQDLRHIAKGMKCQSLRYALLEHSAYGWDFKEEREVDLKALAQEQGQCELVNRYEQMETIENLINWYRERGRGLLSKKMNLEAPLALKKRSNLSLLIPEGRGAGETVAALREVVELDFEGAHEGGLQYCHSNFFVDILGPIHKSDGAKLLLYHFGHAPSDALVVGDGMNDMDMFTDHWPNLLCPQNAYGELKGLCQKLGGSVSEHHYAEATLGYLS